MAIQSSRRRYGSDSRTLIQNAGASPIRILTQLRAKQAEGKSSFGVDGDTGAVVDMKEYGVWNHKPLRCRVSRPQWKVLVYYCESMTFVRRRARSRLEPALWEAMKISYDRHHLQAM